MIKSLTERFWEKVMKDVSECWIWIGARIPGGYGHFDQRGAHRVSWELHFGPVPEGQHVLHHCDNKACVRPDHLFLGDQKKNMEDKMTKSRQARGSRQGKSKLTENDVIDLRILDIPLSALAQLYQISIRQVCNLKKRRQWQHI